ncbi:MAG: hypothetical protein ABFS56_04145 [Pseudomonadota bacterium]
MNLSEFELYVLDALIKGELEEELIRSQLNGATVTKRDYTGVGLYTDIKANPNCRTLSKSNWYIEETPKIHLEHPELEAGAGALLWLKYGYISTLECYTYDGDWPKDESLFVINE